MAGVGTFVRQFVEDTGHRRLIRDGDWIVLSGCYAQCLEMVEERLLTAGRHEYRKEMPARIRPFGRSGAPHLGMPDAVEIFVRDGAAAFDPRVQARQHGITQQRRLKLVQPAVIAYVFVPVLGGLPVVA